MFHELAYVHSSSSDDRKFGDHKPKLKQSNSSANIEKLNARPKVTRKGSLVVGQKLRESKWFTHDEINILCAVLESGFIVQKKDEKTEDHRGIALWTPGYEKSKNPDYVTIYTVHLHRNNYKVQSCNLLNFWPKGTMIKINNQSDQMNTPNSEEVIRSQVSYAQNNRHKWHNSEHFTYWCRYGTPLKDNRAKLINDSLKWGNLGLNAGLLLLRGRKRNMTTSN